jgi:tetratricopeptide (TPR) repeat protein
MRSRLPIPLVTLTGFVCFALLASAHAEQDRGTAREQRILQIQGFIQSGDLAQAGRLLAEAAKQFPADAGFDNLQGVVQAQQGNYRAAEISFQYAIQRNTKLTAAYLNLGRLYQENFLKDDQARRKALEVYQRVLEYEPENAEANYQSAVLLLQQGRFQDSITRVSLLPASTQSTAQALSVLCADYAALGDRKHADELAAQLLASSDFSELDVRQMLSALAVSKRDDLIISLLDSLGTRKPLSPETLRILGLSYERENKLNEARATLERSVTSGNLSVASLLELARVAHEQQDYRGSLGYLAHARDLDPDNARIHYYFGLVCLDLSLVAEARNSFDRAVRLDPESAPYNYAMGAASAFLRDPAEAVPYFKKYLQLKPQDPRAKLALGAAFFRAKDYDSAVPWLAESAQFDQTATTAHYYLGCIALQERRLDEAVKELEEALKAKPEYPDALAELGQYYLMRKDYVQAEKQVRHALELDADHFSANFYLLRLYTLTGDSRREAQAKHYEELQKLREQKAQEFLRMVEVRPFETP